MPDCWRGITGRATLFLVWSSASSPCHLPWRSPLPPGRNPNKGFTRPSSPGCWFHCWGAAACRLPGRPEHSSSILSGITAEHGIDGLQIATVLAGAMLLLLGMARLGTIIKFIPDPVIVGFTSGIAVVIWTGQWRDFFGLPAVAGQHFHEKLWHTLQVLSQAHAVTTALATATLLIVLLGPRLPMLKRVPGPLLGLVFATVVQFGLQFEGVATIGSAFGGIPRGLPSLHLPAISADRVIELIGPALPSRCWARSSRCCPPSLLTAWRGRATIPTRS